MSDPPTPLSLPPNLPYPLTITRLLARPNHAVSRGEPLLEYAFTSDTTRRELERLASVPGHALRGNDMIGTWDSSIDGEIVRWDEKLRPGFAIEIKHIRLVRIPYNYMDFVESAERTSPHDYLAHNSYIRDNQSGPSRYPGAFELAHDALGVTVSTDEARRLETQTRNMLLDGRRLSLIVDLDQTIIHTTVDPTVGEWMMEIEEEESEERTHEQLGFSDRKGEVKIPVGDERGGDEGSQSNGHTTTPLTSTEQSTSKKPFREKNPNAAALKDVARFQLADDLRLGYKGLETGRWYYTKPRPGLANFLESMSRIYEMHVYTMGSRCYANAICSVIDPTGSLFGGRILSRDESGSKYLSQKNLKRLFPTDQSMVVVIDDRSDVWGDCPNLVKVVPYDFFVGIGDINGSFLSSASSNPTLPLPSVASSSDPASQSPSASLSPVPVTPPDSSSLIAQEKLLDQVSDERPLAKMQEELEREDDVEAVATAVNDASREEEKDEAKAAPTSSGRPGSPAKARKSVLNAFDNELDRIADILAHVHSAFYEAYETRNNRTPTAALPLSCDVELIIPDLKSKVLAGCKLVFSGVNPRHVLPESSEIWLAAESFGAQCLSEVTNDTTHCVTAAQGTEKTYRTSKIPGAQVVWVEWFWKSVALWSRQSEEEFLAMPSRVEMGSEILERPTEERKEEEDNEGEAEGLFAGARWDDDAQAELDAFLDESSDVDGAEDEGTEIESSTSSPPGTPTKKRVRYADEERLPLESFKDPSPTGGGGSPPKKRRTLLLGAPDEEVPEANRFRSRTSDTLRLEVPSSSLDEPTKTEESGEADDEFAQMLMDSLAGE
ncbi:MAG: Carboxy-terminal domain (CTD) phosphatase [Tremellales sp. Tagirdzhanova-0007]|nr:MAG: Carboxy-terminal domain (CTD) phosphatase [Tremellales sp. Tagirdzhanova-0007]